MNFSMQLTHITRETRYLDRMTFHIPEYALNVTLQEDRYLQCVDGLTDMLERYYKVRITSASSNPSCMEVHPPGWMPLLSRLENSCHRTASVPVHL